MHLIGTGYMCYNLLMGPVHAHGTSVDCVIRTTTDKSTPLSGDLHHAESSLVLMPGPASAVVTDATMSTKAWFHYAAYLTCSDSSGDPPSCVQGKTY
jgi:hypothetical protein